MISRLFATVLFGLAFTSCVDAQSKDTTEDPAGSVEIIKVRDGQYRYRIKDAAGATIVAPPEQLVWAKSADVQKAIQEFTKILLASEPVEDPETKEEFKNKESAYSYRIRNAKGTIVGVPPPELQWKSRAEVLGALQEVKSILQTATPLEVTDRLPSGEYKGVAGLLPMGLNAKNGKK